MAFAVNRTMSYTRYFEAVDLVFSGATGEPGPNSSAPLTSSTSRPLAVRLPTRAWLSRMALMGFGSIWALLAA